MKITIVNPKKIKIPLRKIKFLAKKVLEFFSEDRDLSICFVDDESMKEYNKRFCHREGSTDVLAFSYSDGSQYLGDIVISYDTARNNAMIFRTNFQDEILLYVIHGILHLLGYDDKTPAGRKKMATLQKRFRDKSQF